LQSARREKRLAGTGTEHIVYIDGDPFLADIGKEMLQELGRGAGHPLHR
jgi:hypothetical protein